MQTKISIKYALSLLVIAGLIAMLLSTFVIANFDFDIGGIEGLQDEQGNIAVPEEAKYPSDCTSHLHIKGAILCINNKRNPPVLAVYGDEDQWYDGSAGSGSFLGNYLDLMFRYCPAGMHHTKCERCDDISCGDSSETCNEDGKPLGCIRGSKKDFRFYPWPEDKEPTLSLNLAGYLNNPLFFRYEGKTWSGDQGITNCRAVFMQVHQKNPSALQGSEPSFDEDDPNAYDVYHILPGQAYEVVPPEIFSYVVDWDNDKNACELIGGDWLEAGKAGVQNPENFRGADGAYRCCGDDWIWLYNNPINYKVPSSSGTELHDRVNNLASPLCLYTSTSGESQYGFPKPVSGTDYSEGYRCDSPGHTQYDPNLNLDDSIEGIDPERGVSAQSNAWFYFRGDKPRDETDLGKWTSNDGAEYAFCDRRFVNEDGEGDVFEWITLQEAGNKDQLRCEVFLGYDWTGTKCCGILPDGTFFNEGTFNDEIKGCDAHSRASDIYKSGYAVSSPEFEIEFDRTCQSLLRKNKACFEGQALENKSMIGSQNNPNVKDVYNENGILYFCDMAQGEQRYTEFDHKPKCTLMGTGYTDFSLCTYTDDSWHGYDESGRFGFRVHSGPKTRAYLEETLHDSRLPPKVLEEAPLQFAATVKQECCLLNSCWDGQECVEELDTYKLDNGVWGPFSFTQDPPKKDGMTIYRCYEGQWHETEAKFNWYHDLDNPNFCIHNHSCYCTAFDCGAANVFGGCTIEENFYTGDHYCEALYDGNSNNVAGSTWSSRTKLLAEQLTELAGNNDFTLFCDAYRNSINYYEPLIGAQANVNSFCVLNSTIGTVIGVSFNVVSSEENAVSSFMFSRQNGFVNELLGENNIETCNYAINNAKNEKHGSFFRCNENNNRLWYNNKTKTIIYTKTHSNQEPGINIHQSELPIPNYNNYHEMFKDNTEGFVNMLDLHKEGSSRISIPSLDKIEYAADFNKIYIAKKGSKKIFGMIETKTDNDRACDIGNCLISIMASSYSNSFGIDCAQVERAARKGSTVVCREDEDGNYFIMSQNSNNNFAYWNDLTAKIRLG